MQFPYQEAAPGIFRPIISVRLHFKNTFVIYDALIDSGADRCIFHFGLIEILKVPLGKQVKLRGISGELLEGVKATINLAVFDWKFRTEVIFSPNLAPMAYGVLGQKGFFDNFKVCFDKSRHQIEITPKMARL